MFQGATTLKPNLLSIGLPDKGLDHKRLKQKSLQGTNFDMKFVDFDSQHSTQQSHVSLSLGRSLRSEL